MQRILVADGPDMEARLAVLLAGHDVTFAHTLHEAAALLERISFDGVLIGVHFDESRMFDLLRYVRAAPRNAATPVLCVLGRRFESAAIGIEGLAIATRALGANHFVDLSKYADEREADAALRAALGPLIGNP
jgi:DNA-binding response OmpR family regulator